MLFYSSVMITNCLRNWDSFCFLMSDATTVGFSWSLFLFNKKIFGHCSVIFQWMQFTHPLRNCHSQRTKSSLIHNVESRKGKEGFPGKLHFKLQIGDCLLPECSPIEVTLCTYKIRVCVGGGRSESSSQNIIFMFFLNRGAFKHPLPHLRPEVLQPKKSTVLYYHLILLNVWTSSKTTILSHLLRNK